ncbi:Hypothetical predicted protein [Lecanosticta acicola]|uniref:Apple domain-containing protein n=1 Tax=Lecanosticta acicola TaxID=111012 RepID=A0AAI9EC84_9PEZI|nr:Hypothetical predicted protein [Lecanosticta acicola]
MRSFALLPILAGIAAALPQDACSTTTVEKIVPTKTATYTSTPVVTEHATTAKDLGTFTLVTTISSTKTLLTLTHTDGTCGETGIVTIPFATHTVYGNSSTPEAYRVKRSPASPPSMKRALGLNPRDDAGTACTVTVTSTTTYGQTQTYVAAHKTSTYTDYTAFTQHTVTSTKSGGTAYAIDSATTSSATRCGSVTVTPTLLTKTVSMDTRCSPSAMVSSYNSYGIEYLSNTPTAGASYSTNATDASTCCQLCAETDECATSAWDVRSGECRLDFPVNPTTGDLNCGEGVLGYYDAGPNHPMLPGTGWYVAKLCGNAQFGSAAPDDGT